MEVYLPYLQLCEPTFSNFTSQLSILSYISFRCLGNWNKFIVSYTKILQVKKCVTKIRYQFPKKTVYFKNRCGRCLVKKSAQGPDFVAW